MLFVMVMLVVLLETDTVQDNHPLIQLHLDQRILISLMVHRPRFSLLVSVRLILLAFVLVELHLLDQVSRYLLFVMLELVPLILFEMHLILIVVELNQIVLVLNQICFVCLVV
jgi:hypothetical protein